MATGVTSTDDAAVGEGGGGAAAAGGVDDGTRSSARLKLIGHSGPVFGVDISPDSQVRTLPLS